MGFLKKVRLLGHSPDYFLMFVFVALVFSGLIFLSSASFDLAKIKFDDAYYYLKHQILFGFVPGLALFLVGYVVYYRKWKKLAPIFILTGIALTLLVYTPLGLLINGSRRWVSVFGFSFQPTEILKIATIVYFAAIFSNLNKFSSRYKRDKGLRSFIVFLLVTGIVSLIILKQPATTMAVIIASSSFVVYFVSGARLRYIFVSVLLFLFVVAIFAIVTPYRLSRVAPFWNETAGRFIPSLQIKNSEDIKVDKYHSERAIISIKSGGLFGVGFGKSTSKFSVLPEPISDSIFAVISEETGFVGSMVVIVLFALFVFRSFLLSMKTHDSFARLLMVGFASVIAIQAFIHILANSGLGPYTGIPLPFISYGGTSLAVTMWVIGVMLNISRHTSLKK